MVRGGAGPCGADVKDHLMQLKCSRFTPVSETLIPTGEIAEVAETPFDFRVGKPVREGFADVPGGHGFDHNLVIDKVRDVSTNATAFLYESGEASRSIRARNCVDGVVC